MIFAYRNPYYDQDFVGFFGTLFMRIVDFMTGRLGVQDLVSDEVQMLVLIGVALSSGMVGTFLVLRRMTMLANALSHTILIGIVVAFLLFSSSVSGEHPELPIQGMLFASLLMGLVTTFLTEFLTRTLRLQEDASIGIVFTSLFALGIIFVTIVTRNVHIGTEAVMGNVDGLHRDDISLVYLVVALNVICFALFFKEFKITAFDPGLSRALGISTVCFNYLLMILTSATAVGAFRAVGVLMVLAFLTGPVLTARLLTHNLKWVLIDAMAIGAVASVTGVALARHLLTVYDIALTTSGLVVCIIVVFFICTLTGKAFTRSSL